MGDHKMRVSRPASQPANSQQPSASIRTLINRPPDGRNPRDTNAGILTLQATANFSKARQAWTKKRSKKRKAFFLGRLKSSNGLLFNSSFSFASIIQNLGIHWSRFIIPVSQIWFLIIYCGWRWPARPACCGPRNPSVSASSRAPNSSIAWRWGAAFEFYYGVHCWVWICAGEYTVQSFRVSVEFRTRLNKLQHNIVHRTEDILARATVVVATSQ